MLTRRLVTTDGAPRSPFDSQAATAAGLVFVSGQAGHDPVPGALDGLLVSIAAAALLQHD